MGERTRPAPTGDAPTVRLALHRDGPEDRARARLLLPVTDASPLPKNPIPGHIARRGGPGTADGRAGAYREESNA